MSTYFLEAKQAAGIAGAAKMKYFEAVGRRAADGGARARAHNAFQASSPLDSVVQLQNVTQVVFVHLTGPECAIDVHPHITLEMWDRRWYGESG